MSRLVLPPRATVTSLLALGLWLACVGSNLAASAPVELLVEPSELALHGRRDSAQVVATLKLADGTLRDITHAAQWESSDPKTGQVAKGRVSPLADGAFTARVTFADPAADSKSNLLSAEVRVSVADYAGRTSLNFRRDVEPILSKYGCNSGGCHGKLVGQNGFRLSLFGFDPAADYNALTREGRGRRVFPAVAEKSLLLLKASNQTPHGGGRRLDSESEAFATLRQWIAEGIPWGEQDLSDLQRIVVSPRERVMQRDAEQQLRVTLFRTDGTTRDITAEAEYRSQRAEVVSIDGRGLATTNDVPGEGTLLVRYLGLVDIARVSVPFSDSTPADAYQDFQPANVIDQLTLAKWRKLGITPSAASTDAEFLRRAYLDTIGVLPEPSEVRAFLADAAPDKRAKLVDHLLARPEFVDYWALQLGDLLQNRRERDHDVRGVKSVRQLHQWLREQLAVARPWDQIARDVLTASGDSTTTPAIGYFVVNIGEGQAEQSELVTSVAQAFLGTRLGCAKCHNHPLEKYTQDDYYHFAAFLSRIKLERHNPAQGPNKLLVSMREANENKRPVGVTQPRTGQFMAPQTLERNPIAVEPGEDPRQKLAAWITDPSNEFFSGAMVNRLVRHFLGYGLVEPVDDLRATNPPTNLKLSRAMSQEFVDHKFDLRHVMRLILNSRTYQLSSATRGNNATDLQFYSHYYARRLPAEVLLDALSLSTGVPDRFPGYPVGVRATQLPDPGLNSYFLSLFGRSERTTACACERRGEVTLPQLLHLQNGDSVVQKIRDARGRLAKLQADNKSPEAIIEELFLASLSRLPTGEELAAIQNVIKDQKPDEGIVDLYWALLNSKEFGFNH